MSYAQSSNGVIPQFLNNDLCASPPSSEPEFEEALNLLRQLEFSLRNSQSALLGRDLDVIRKCSLEQKQLKTRLARLSSCLGLESGRPEASATMRRILHLGKVQASLLLRAQLSIRTLANLRAGTRVVYDADQGALFAADARE